MLEAPIPPDEAKRLELLRACRIIYTPAEQAFDDVARLAADICGTEIALITLVDSDRQWFKARVGVDVTGTARDLSFCGHCIMKRTPLVVEDTLLDQRFADNPLVTGDPGLRFYAGVPLLVDEGSAVGAISVADRSPRPLSQRQLDSLCRLSQQISRELRLRRDLDRLVSSRPKPGLHIARDVVIGGKWRVKRELGRGGVGVVFEALDEQGERVAIKVLLPEWRQQEHVLERFAREARVLKQLTTPHVGKLIDVGNLDPDLGDLPFLVLEYLEGMDLDRILNSHGRVPYRQALAWCADACEGVSAAHELGVVHRDLKPSNVFLARTAAPEAVVKVLDFGIATSGDPTSNLSSNLTGMEQLLGTPAYMSPEQMMASKNVDARSDIWSMGVLMYQLITGYLPFPGEGGLEMFANAMTRPPLPLRAEVKEEVPQEVQTILLTCLHKQPEDRFPSMHELSKAIRAVAA